MSDSGFPPGNPHRPATQMNPDSTLDIQGIVQRHPVPELIVEIGQAGLAGSLRVSNRDRKVIMYFKAGVIAFAVSNAKEHRLFSILLSQERIQESDLAAIEDYVNDFKLSKGLVAAGMFTQAEMDSYFGFQVALIVASAAAWTEGSWVFSPLARLKRDLDLQIDVREVLYRSSGSLSAQSVLSRFKSYKETFAAADRKASPAIELDTKDAFVLSRLDETPLTIEEIEAASGLKGPEVMPILYRLWLGGFTIRGDWNKALGKEALDKIAGAKLTLKRSAKSIEEEERLKAEEAKRAAQAEARKRAEEEARERAAEARRERERLDREADYKETDISLEDYLDRVEAAPTYYELFGIKPDASPATVKRAYFSFARRFHPDVFQKKVDVETHKRVQQAFTEIASAYETLKEPESRELYDLKLGRLLEALDRHDSDLSGLSREDLEAEKRAAVARDNFERGVNFMDNGHFEDAAPHLGRAVHLEPENAEYRAFHGLALSRDKRHLHKAEAELREAVKLAPDEIRFRLMLAELYVEIGLSVRATNEIRKILSDDPGNARARELLKDLGSSK